MGGHYFPLDTFVNKLSHVVKNNGKRIGRMVKELLDEGYLLAHGGGETISLNLHDSSMNARYRAKLGPCLTRQGFQH